MKKVFAIFLVLIMICSFAACGNKGNANTDDGRNPAIVAYMEKNSDELIEGMEASFAGSSGMTCKSSWAVDGNDIILTIKINELDDLDDDTKDLMQETFDSMDAAFDPALESIQKEVPEVESLTLKVCEKDGDVIATIVID